MTHTPSPLPRFLNAPGRLGAQILAFDWSQTPLGAIADWPQSLKAVVSLMLNSPQPMWIGWGEQATFLYNDAYINVLSMAKHPWALGRPAAEVWAEIWDICGPLVDKVFLHGEATMADDVRLFMRRGDFLEETFYSFSYSPVRDESGNVAGLFCPNLDVTAKHLNARRLRTISEMSTRALQEKTVQGACAIAVATIADNPDDLPFALLYLAGEEGEPASLAQATHAGLAAARDVFAVDGVIAGGAARLVGWDRAVDGMPAGLAGQRIGQALVLPLAGGADGKAAGALVLGVSAARRLDDDYRSFMEVIATQTGNAIRQARAAEDERLRADMLAELDRAKTQFFSNVSHEFRTPLTLLLGPIEDALGDAAEPLPPAQHARLQLMLRNALRLQKLVNTLLDFSRVQAGRAQAHFAPTDLPALTADLASSFRSAVEAAGMRLVVDCPPLPAPVHIDAGMWENIILNLLSNAFKFTFAGEIRVAVRAVGGAAEVTVADTGTGIAADQLPMLFARFHRVAGARARTHEGSGIGLALVHDLVALHGGAIAVDSTPGKGTTFRVTIPFGVAHLDPAQLHDAPSPASVGAARAYVSEAESWTRPGGVLAAPAPAPSSAAPLGRLLVADDNADMRDYLRRLLQPQWQVEVCGNGVEALAAVARAMPDMIVSDVMMPELDGFGLLAALRADAATRELPFILLSARAGEEARLEGLQAGADDYLVKPFSGRELVARVDVLRLRQGVRAAEQAAARRMQAIFSQAPVAVAILRGAQHVYEQANAHYQELVGERPLLGLPVRTALAELEGQGIFELLDGVLASGQPYVGRSVQIKLRRGVSTGLADCYFDFVYQPLFDDGVGAPSGIAVVAFEVTELARAKRAAEMASRAKDEFLAMLGHELRNPLAPIVTALQLMQLRGGDYAQKERAVIERQTRHLVTLVDDLLDVSRVAEGKIQLHREPVEIAEVVARAIETASPLIEAKRHVLDLAVPATGLAVLADPARCAQVLSNLLANAAKYTEAGGRLQVAARRDGDDVVVAVRDNGIGIDAAMLPTIFDLFVQERQALSRSQGGLGLGLSIARSMMALHGGSVTAHSDGVGRGCEFSIRLAALALDHAAPAPPPSACGPAEAPGSGLAIMVVDDNEDAARALGELLALHGHAVEVVYDAPAALALAQRFHPDVGLLDIGLPGMDGYELAQRLRRQLDGEGDAGAALRLFALTGYGQESDRRRAAEAGFDAHLTKPIDVAALLELLCRNRVGEFTSK
jgi:signal transduction histidine kinase